MLNICSKKTAYELPKMDFQDQFIAVNVPYSEKINNFKFLGNISP